MTTDKIRSFSENFYAAYLKRQNMKEILAALDDQVLWSSTYSKEIIKGKNKVEQLLYSTFMSHPYTLYVGECVHLEYQLKESLVLLNSRIELSLIEKQSFSFPLFGSLIISQKEDHLSIAQVHFSLFGSEKMVLEYILNYKEGEGFPESQLKTITQLKLMNEELLTLTNNAPASILSCNMDDSFTLTYISNGFYNMMGFSYEEIKEKFNNSFLEIIDRRDRREVAETINKQLLKKQMINIEYRVRHKDGHIIWVSGKAQLIEDIVNQKSSLYFILIDITQEKYIQEELQMSLERYDIIMNQTNDVVFEWNIPSDMITVSANWENMFKKTGKKVSSKRLLYGDCSDKFHPEDLEKARALFCNISKGATYLEQELRMKRVDEYIWCRLRITTQLDYNLLPARAIGIIIDIDEEKKKSASLLERSQKDALTGMYNKITVQSKIQNYISKIQTRQECAMMILDIDNFKYVNDLLGHMVGDAVLSDIAQIIKRNFRSDDLIGRIGGDEFIVLMKNTSDLGQVYLRCCKIIDSIQSIEICADRQCEISCSIGIALYPEHGKSFQDLYKKADLALYEAKKNGKKQYILFDDSSEQNSQKESYVNYRSVINAAIDSDENNKVLTEKVAEYVFRILYKSIDVATAVNTILEIVGRQFDVSRMYIFENMEGDEYCSNTFEWCNMGVEPQIDKLQMISYERDLGGNYIDNFNEDGIFYCRDITDLPPYQVAILEPQGIKSMLQCAIKSNGVFRGYVGFDECRKSRYWTQEQMDSLTFISEILSVFLLKNRAEENLRMEGEGLRAILDNQNSYVYIIEPGTMKLQFINKRTFDVAPNARIGMCCYEAFQNRSTPCEICPAMAINSNVKNNTHEFYNEHLKIWTNADASHITWKGREAVLLSCHDITKYKVTD